MKTDTDTWASEQPGAQTTWIEFLLGPDLSRPEEEQAPRRYRINASFMLSNWRCIFGDGCPGVLLTGEMYDRGCCQIGVHVAKDEVKKLNGLVKQLTPKDLDADLLAKVRLDGWKYKEKDPEQRDAGYTHHTRIVDGACILANRQGGSSGQIGCSLHVLANRLGVRPIDTKPDICWQLPVVASEWYDEDDDEYVIEVSNVKGSTWGDKHTTDVSYPGWFCTETPDAYRDDSLVYSTNEDSLRKQMGDEAYEEMARRLDEYLEGQKTADQMPGERINGGRPLIPLMVANRMHAWEKDVANPASETVEESREALKRSDALML